MGFHKWVLWVSINEYSLVLILLWNILFRNKNWKYSNSLDDYLWLLSDIHAPISIYVVFPGGTVAKNLPANAEDTRDVCFDPWVGMLLWRRKWLPTLVFLPAKFHGQRSLVGCSQVQKELDMSEHGCHAISRYIGINRWYIYINIANHVYISISIYKSKLCDGLRYFIQGQL